MRSMAWEVSEEDVYQVLAAHQRAENSEDPRVEEAFDVVAGEADRVEGAILEYIDMDDQTEAALAEIETILVEAELLPEDARAFEMP